MVADFWKMAQTANFKKASLVLAVQKLRNHHRSSPAARPLQASLSLSPEQVVI